MSSGGGLLVELVHVRDAQLPIVVGAREASVLQVQGREVPVNIRLLSASEDVSSLGCEYIYGLGDRL